MNLLNPFLLIPLFIPLFLLSDLSGVEPHAVREGNTAILAACTLFLVLLTVDARIRRGLPRLRGLPLVVPLTAFLLWSGVLVPFSSYPWGSLMTWRLILLASLLYYGASALPTTLVSIRDLMYCLFVLGAGVLAYSFFSHFTGPDAVTLRDMVDTAPLSDRMRKQIEFSILLNRAKALFGNPNHLGAWLNLFAVVPLGLLAFGEVRRIRVLSGVYLLFHVWMLRLTESRGSLIGFLAAVSVVSVLFTWHHRGREFIRKGRFWGFLVAGLALIGLGILLLKGPGDLLRLFQTKTLETRIVWWRAAGILAWEHPWTGIGPGMFSLWYPSVREIGAPESQYVHNLLLETGAEQGILGLGMLLWVQLATLRMIWTRLLTCHKDGRPMLAASAAAVISFGIHTNLEFLHVQAEILGLFALYWGVAGNPALTGSRLPEGTDKGRRWHLGVLAPLLGILWYSIYFCPWRGISRMHAGLEMVQGDPLQARIEFARASAWMPFNAEPYYLLGSHAFWTRGQPQEALPLLQEAVQRSPRTAYFYETLSSIYWNLGKTDEALASIRKAILLHSAKGSYYAQRSGYREASGDLAGASEDREMARVRSDADARLDPDLEALRILQE